jgi:hypothetical protein
MTGVSSNFICYLYYKYWFLHIYYNKNERTVEILCNDQINNELLYSMIIGVELCSMLNAVEMA